MVDQRVPANLPSPFLTGLLGRCPRCGGGTLFKGYLALDDECGECGLEYSFANSGDGPTVFVILIAGFIVTGLALFVEVSYQPPLWGHAALWTPVGLGLPLLLLRPFKATLLALQYRFSAEEARRADHEDNSASP